jgi:hypothetical protein
MSETIIIGEFTISKLRSGEAVEFDNGTTIIPASDLATTEALRARVAKLEDAGENVIIAFNMGWDMDGVIEVLCAALKDTSK